MSLDPFRPIFRPSSIPALDTYTFRLPSGPHLPEFGTPLERPGLSNGTSSRDDVEGTDHLRVNRAED